MAEASGIVAWPAYSNNYPQASTPNTMAEASGIVPWPAYSNNYLQASDSNTIMEAQTFHFYPKLPREIKLLIWELAVEEEPGVHTFRLYQSPCDMTKLVLAQQTPKRDHSAWRDRKFTHASSVTAVDAWHFLTLLRHELQYTKVYKPIPGKRRPRVLDRDINSAALIHKEHDVVMFNFNYGNTDANLAFLEYHQNVAVFAGITRVGISASTLAGMGSLNRPFRCQCIMRHACHVCPQSVVLFLRYFQDLKVVYVVSQSPSGWTNDEIFAPTVLKRIRRIPARCDSEGEKARLDKFRWIQEVAKQKGLLEFQDRRSAYCEITDDDYKRIMGRYYRDNTHVQKYRHVWTSYHEQPGRYHQIEGGFHANWKEVKFLNLIHCNVQGLGEVGEGTDGSWLRSPEPYN